MTTHPPFATSVHTAIKVSKPGSGISTQLWPETNSTIAMLFSTPLAQLGALATLGTAVRAAYTIQDTYDTTSFFNGFNFFSTTDPTNGFVQYRDALNANMSSLAGYSNGGIYLGVDSTTQNPTGGRNSVRVYSKKTYTKGLFIADITHMPTSSQSGCGLWPAFWMFGEADGWPNDGEIDVIEGVNSAQKTTFTLHTSAGCTFSQGDCNAGSGNTGCGQNVTDTQTYGSGFNAVGGGVYAVEWTSSAISIWFFSRAAIPADITSGAPDPTTWGTATGQFSGSGCDIDSHFKGHQIVFNTDFCGDWAGNVWSTDATCSKLASTCQEYVAANPADFKDAYWLINSVKVYNQTTNSKRYSGKVETIPMPFVA